MIDDGQIPQTLDIHSIEAWKQAMNTLLFLRSKDGCSWDQTQTMESIIVNLIEEVSELIDAIHTYSHNSITETATDSAKQHLIEEFGDVYLVLSMMTIIFTEANTQENSQNLVFSEIFTQLKDKLIRRHPHIFSHSVIEQSKNDLHAQWLHIKYHVEGKREPEKLSEYKPYLHILERVKEIQKSAEKIASNTKLSFKEKFNSLSKSIKNLEDAESKLPDEESYALPPDVIQLHIGRCLFELVDLARSLHLSPTTCLSKYMAHYLEAVSKTKNS